LARLPTPALRRTALAGFANDLAMLFTSRWPAIELAVEKHEAPAHLLIDPDQLTAALWAVLQNAAEALGNAPDAKIHLIFKAR
ncbi:hypothetical protein ACO1LA_14330, partial [Staphylococcus aureus]